MYNNKILYGIALCALQISLYVAANSQPTYTSDQQRRFEQTAGTIKIVLIMDDIQNIPELQNQIPLAPYTPYPLDTNTIDLTTSALLKKTCLVPDTSTPAIETPLNLAVKEAWFAAMPTDATIYTVPALNDPKMCITKMLSPTDNTLCGCPALPAIEQIIIHVINENSFKLIKSRLILNNKIIPTLYALFSQERKKYGADSPQVQRLALVIKILANNLKK